MTAKTSKKFAFLDRDGALIYEPEGTFQVDSLDQLKILPGVLDGLKKLMKFRYRLVMVSNQDGIGTERYPQKNFDRVQGRLIELFADNGIVFDAVYICPHLLVENCLCRKPKTGLVEELFKTEKVDLINSFMYGDRETDGQFAKNLGIRFIKATTNEPFNLGKFF